MTSNRLNRNQRRTFKLLPGANSHVVNLERPLPLRENVSSVSSSPEAYGHCLEKKQIVKCYDLILRTLNSHLINKLKKVTLIFKESSFEHLEMTV